MSTKKDKKDKDKTKDKDKDKDKNDKNKVEKGKDDKEKAKDAPATLHAPTTDSVPSIKTLSRQEVKFTRNESGDYIFQSTTFLLLLSAGGSIFLHCDSSCSLFL